MRQLQSALVALAVATTLAGVAVAWRIVPAAAQAPAKAPIAASKIAFVDLNRIAARSAAGAAAREQFEKERAGMQKEMDSKLEEIKKLSEELEKKGALMAPDARREKQEQFDRKRRDAARLADDLGKELEKRERMLGQKLLQEIAGLIQQLGKERGYYMIVEGQRAGVLYGSAEADLTEEVIKLYDAGAKAKKP